MVRRLLDQALPGLAAVVDGLANKWQARTKAMTSVCVRLCALGYRIRSVAPTASLSRQTHRDFGLGRLYVIQQDFEICLSVRSEGTKDRPQHPLAGFHTGS